MRTPDTLPKHPRLMRVAALALLATGLVLAACSRTTTDPLTLAPTSLLDGTGLRATLASGAAEFHFPAELAAGTYRVDLSTSPDLSTDVYGAFGAGDSSPIVVVDPQQRWDKYVCGASLYWRVTFVPSDGSDLVSPIQGPTIVCPENPFSDLGAALNQLHANFDFAYAGTSDEFTITASAAADMSGTVWSTTGTTGPVRLVDPETAWDGYRCGIVLYWRVTDGDGISSPIQEKHVCSSVGFSAEKAVLQPGRATFAFRHRGTTNHYRIDLSTVADMSRDVYVGFGTGQTSPIVVDGPSWDKYRCGATLYWRVNELLNGQVGRIQTATVACP